MEVGSMPMLERVGRHMHEDCLPSQPHDRASHAASSANTTDSMISVSLSNGQAAESGHARKESNGSGVTEGSIDLDSDYEEAVVEEAVTVTRARGGSIYAARDNESAADPSIQSFKVEPSVARIIVVEEERLVRATSPSSAPEQVGDEGIPIDAQSTSEAADKEEEEEHDDDDDDDEHDDDGDDAGPAETDKAQTAKPAITVDTDMAGSRPGSVPSFDAVQDAALPDRSARTSTDLQSRHSDRMSAADMDEVFGPIEEKEEVDDNSHLRPRSDSAGSGTMSPVDWARLDRTEQQEQKSVDDTTDEQTALLLARLEQENQAIATDPKAALAKQRARKLTAGRPPSIYEVKSLVQKSHRQSLRLSRMPSPPPMTELDFWAALVQDYPSTAQRLPTLTSNKIRGGIPPPLRGVVWVSMAGARDKYLEEQYHRLCGEQSPYENIISKDIGRSFPGVEMFRDPDGEGQRMLGRVLKCFSLHDTKIGYCQGLGFLVGPLLMQMGERDAFCVLVRLMEDYDLRSCFQEDLSGLHLRVYQFQELLHQHLPTLAAHLDEMQVEAAYLSQWFLSFFAVTCPLPMLFRIYDVIFAEGASETIMRVALSVMRRNEKKILGLTEFEDVMQLLLGRALWDTYGLHKGSGDELVNDFVSFTSLVTRENLRELDASFKTAQISDSSHLLSFLPDVQSAASKFLGRLWAPAASAQTTRSAHLSPTALPPTGSAASARPGSILRRSASAQSLASTHKSNEFVSDSLASSSATTMTDATTFSRILSDEYAGSVKSSKTQMGSIESALKPSVAASQDQEIEDMLMALSDMQREHAQLAAQLAKEREEREEDAQVVRKLLDGLARDKRSSKRVPEDLSSRRRTTPATRRPVSVEIAGDKATEPHSPVAHKLSSLVASAEYRFPLTPGHQRRSATLETRPQLRQALAQAREHVVAESSRSADLSRQLEDKDREAGLLRDELREARSRIQLEFGEKQRLEKTVVELRQARRKSNANTSPPRLQTRIGSDISLSTTVEVASRSRSNSGSSTKAGGLRELMLVRSQTAATPQQFSKRTSSLATQAVLGSLATNVPPARSVSSAASISSEDAAVPSSQDQHDREALLLELVNAKTAEAIARQELDEMRGRFESMRKMLGQPSPASINATPVTTPGMSNHKTTPSEGFLSFMNTAANNLASAVTPKEGVVSITPASPEPEKKHAPVGSWGWGWGKRSGT